MQSLLQQYQKGVEIRRDARRIRVNALRETIVEHRCTDGSSCVRSWTAAIEESTKGENMLTGALQRMRLTNAAGRNSFPTPKPGTMEYNIAKVIDDRGGEPIEVLPEDVVTVTSEGTVGGACRKESIIKSWLKRHPSSGGDIRTLHTLHIDQDEKFAAGEVYIIKGDPVLGSAVRIYYADGKRYTADLVVDYLGSIAYFGTDQYTGPRFKILEILSGNGQTFQKFDRKYYDDEFLPKMTAAFAQYTEAGIPFEVYAVEDGRDRAWPYLDERSPIRRFRRMRTIDDVRKWYEEDGGPMCLEGEAKKDFIDEHNRYLKRIEEEMGKEAANSRVVEDGTASSCSSDCLPPPNYDRFNEDPLTDTFFLDELPEDQGSSDEDYYDEE